MALLTPPPTTFLEPRPAPVTPSLDQPALAAG